MWFFAACIAVVFFVMRGAGPRRGCAVEISEADYEKGRRLLQS